MYVVIVGAGDIGRPLIEMATRDGNEVVVIESDPERANEAAMDFDCLVLNADATTKETLEEAEAGRADSLVSTTDHDATNVMVCLLARELDVPTVVSVVHDPEHMALFERIGVNTMKNPQRLIAEHLYRSARRPSIVDHMHIGETAEVFEVEVFPNGEVAGLTLAEAAEAGHLGDEMLVVAVERDDGEPPITPRGNTRIEPEDLLTIYSASGVPENVDGLFGRPDK
ncbi:TrkA family potassium uptake protein [Haloparvum alkalitolerans]|uniref:potassium channel family protein n=1 Tax=Haloparvum alkalitolerans TaxID=1042953 RepID=UPI003CECF2E5